MKDPELIKKIKEGDEEALRYIYQTNRKGFIDFSVRFNLEKEDVLDIYQDAVIVFYENARKGKLDFLKSTITTYIFAIGKYKIYALLKRERNEIPLDEVSAETLLMQDEEFTADAQVKRLQKALGALGSKCRELLTLFYYEGKKLEEIQEKLGYESRDVLKSQKSRCLKKLKELASNK